MHFFHRAYICTVALLKKILKPNPAKRYTIEKIRSHLWCRKYATEHVYTCTVYMYLTVCVCHSEERMGGFWNEHLTTSYAEK